MLLPSRCVVGVALRKDDNGGKLFRMGSDCAGNASIGLAHAIVAVVASAVQRDDDGPGSGAIEVARYVDHIAEFAPVDADGAVQESGLGGLRGEKWGGERQQESEVVLD